MNHGRSSTRLRIAVVVTGPCARTTGLRARRLCAGVCFGHEWIYSAAPGASTVMTALRARKASTS